MTAVHTAIPPCVVSFVCVCIRYCPAGCSRHTVPLWMALLRYGAHATAEARHACLHWPHPHWGCCLASLVATLRPAEAD